MEIDQKGRIEFISRLLGGESALDQAISNTPQSALDAAIAATGHAVGVDDMSRVGKAILDAMLDSPGSTLSTAKNTMWGAVNGVTYYADHIAPSRAVGNRVFGAWFGKGEALKTEAIHIAADMAGITL